MSSATSHALENLKSLTRRWRAFPNIGVKAYYEPFTQTIVLNSIEAKHIQQLASTGVSFDSRELLRLIVHEVAHWVDHVATLWGQRLLVRLFDGIHARLSNDPSQFWRIREAQSAIGSIHLPSFYSTVGEAARESWDGVPWLQAVTLGYEYGIDGRLRRERPLVFVRFQTFDGRDVARVPMTISSLTETSAVASEIVYDVGLLQTLTERQQAVERHLLSREYKRRLYDGTLCLYSAMAHFVANRTKTTDVVLGYLRSSRLATLCFNLPSMAYDRLQSASSALFAPVQSAMRLRLAANDPSFAFATIAACGPQDDSMPPNEWVSAAAAAAGLPELEVLDNHTRLEMDRLRAIVAEGPEVGRLRSLLEAGSRIYKVRKIAGQNTSLVVFPHVESQEFPPIMLGSGELFQLGKPISGLSGDDHTAWLDRAFQHELQFMEFSEACLP